MPKIRASRIKVWSYALWSFAWTMALAGAFLVTWTAPYTFGELTVHKFTFMMLLEFLVVHSTGFFSAVSIFGENKMGRALQFAGLTLFYLLFAAAFSAMYGGPWPFYAFLLLAIPQFKGVVWHPARRSEDMLLGLQWSGMVLLYLGGIFFTLTADIPQLGVTAEVIARQNFQIEGEWPEQPFRVMAFGAIYFTGKAFLNLLLDLIWVTEEDAPEKGK